MDITIRLEQKKDYEETENMVREAFWNHHGPGCDEHYLLHIMRDCKGFVPQLNFVAVQDGRIIGHIAYMEAIIEGDGGNTYPVLTLGPISVLPEFQAKGVGCKLIAHTRRLAREMKFQAILLYGDPGYYEKQGFISAESLGIRTADNMYAAALQVCTLYDGALSGIKGRLIENDIYIIDQADAEAFDRNFPPREKVCGTPSQMRFKEIVAMRKPAV